MITFVYLVTLEYTNVVEIIYKCKYYLHFYGDFLYMPDLSSHFKALREWSGMSQKDFASQFELTRAQVASYEAGSEPKIQKLKQIVDFFNIDVENFLSENFVEYLGNHDYPIDHLNDNLTPYKEAENKNNSIFFEEMPTEWRQERLEDMPDSTIARELQAQIRELQIQVSILSAQNQWLRTHADKMLDAMTSRTEAASSDDDEDLAQVG